MACFTATMNSLHRKDFIINNMLCKLNMISGKCTSSNIEVASRINLLITTHRGLTINEVTEGVVVTSSKRNRIRVLEVVVNNLRKNREIDSKTKSIKLTLHKSLLLQQKVQASWVIRDTTANKHLVDSSRHQANNRHIIMIIDSNILVKVTKRCVIVQIINSHLICINR